MNNKNQISEIWLKSAIIGTVWASSEIVLGSFLHNLKVPFSGSILTAIAIVILVSVSFVWKEKGIFWRAGLICALMKTMSPSAVIFGPMIAIFAEALLLEGSVRIFGKTYLGFIIGAVLAVSWTFAQKIINFLIFYGFNIVELYKGLMKFTEKQLNLHFDTFWAPILILLSVYAFIGLFSAILGIKTGKKLISQPIQYQHKTYNNQGFLTNKDLRQNFNYSIIWLVIDILLIITSLLLISFFNWKVWTIFIIIITGIWVLRYKRAFRQLTKPKFWVFFVVITMLTAFVFTKLQAKPLLNALLIGIEMNFRATILILGFSTLGTELYNPKIRNLFARTYLKNLPLALELSTESLPLVIANIPDFKTVLKNPTKIVSQLIAYAEFRFKEIKKNEHLSQKIFIVTGEIDSGKTNFIKKLVDVLKEKEIQVGGIYSKKIFEQSKRIGYDVVDINTNKSTPFLRTISDRVYEKIGIFHILPAGLKFGIECLKTTNNFENEIVIIDEVGKLELSGKGWSSELEKNLKLQKSHLLLVIRKELIEESINKWNLKNSTLIKIPELDFQTATNQIISEIKL